MKQIFMVGFCRYCLGRRQDDERQINRWKKL